MVAPIALLTRTASLLCAAVTLAGCYESSTQLLDTTQPEKVLPIGRVVLRGEPVNVEAGAGGSYRVTDLRTGEQFDVLFNRLGPGHYAASLQTGSDFVYGAAVLRDGELRLYFPSCDVLDDRRAATASGATDSGPQLLRTCSYRSTSALFAALSSPAIESSAEKSDIIFRTSR